MTRQPMIKLIHGLTVFAAMIFGCAQALAQITVDQNPATVGVPVNFSVTGNYSVFYWGFGDTVLSGSWWKTAPQDVGLLNPTKLHY